MEIREEVQWFAGEMEKKLQANDHKLHWRNIKKEYLFNRLLEEVEELAEALFNTNPNHPKRPENIIKEAADVANFAMAIADNYSKRPNKQISRLLVDQVKNE